MEVASYVLCTLSSENSEAKRNLSVRPMKFRGCLNESIKVLVSFGIGTI